MVFLKRLLILLLLFPLPAYAGTYWVDTTGGAANWAACEGADPGAGHRCKLDGAQGANANAAAGDTVYLVSGTNFTTATGWGIIHPVNSGSAGNVIRFTSAAGGTAKVVSATNYYGFILEGVDYIKIDNIDFTGSSVFFNIGDGADYNEIAYNTFSGATGKYSLGIIQSKTTAGTGGTASTNNWLHHNTFEKYGAITACDDLGTIRIRNDAADDGSGWNTVENNTFSYGGHDAFDLGGQYNVFRNNILHNEEVYFASDGTCTNAPASGYYGDRNLILTDYGTGTTHHNLVEGNRLGHAGTPPDDDGASGIENAGEYSIIRFNLTYGNGLSGIELKTQNTGNSDSAHVYNNTIYYNGRGDASLLDAMRSGIFVDCNTADHPANIQIKNNIIYGNYTDDINYYGAGGACSAQFTVANSLTTDPKFINPSLTDKTSSTLPNLKVQSGSGAIKTGTSLTLANGAGNASTSLTVDDALYFQAGSAAATTPMGASISSVAGDYILINNQIRQITDINYTTNVLTLNAAASWADDAPVYLYKKSDGVQVSYGGVMDIGAEPYSAPAGNFTLGEGGGFTLGTEGGGLILQ